MSGNALTVRELTKSFGELVAVNGCTMEVPEGVIAGVIGPNGAGKTTLFNLISGLLWPDAGAVHLNGRDITRLPAHKRSDFGLGRTFQITRSLQKMTVLDNLKLAAPAQLGENICNLFFRPRQVRRQEQEIEEKALDILRLLDLYHLREEYAGNLSGGQKKLLEIGRMSMLDPEVVLMDEPLAGVNPALGEKISGHLQRLKEESRTILLVEHNVKNLMRISDIVFVMNDGRMISHGPPESIRRDEKVIAAYLGAVG